MEKLELEKDITVMYVPAASFPDGIEEAFKNLQKRIPPGGKRVLFGISWPDRNGKIMYKAAVEEKFVGEAKDFGLDTFVIKKGTYTSERIKNYRENIQQIGNSFSRLLEHPELDMTGCCVEWYKEADEVICMVRLTQEDKATVPPHGNIP